MNFVALDMYFSYLDVVRDTTEIACGDCYRHQEIPFVFYPDLEGVSSDYDGTDAQIHFSLRVKVLFTNHFFCVKYLPVHFSW